MSAAEAGARLGGDGLAERGSRVALLARELEETLAACAVSEDALLLAHQERGRLLTVLLKKREALAEAMGQCLESAGVPPAWLKR